MAKPPSLVVSALATWNGKALNKGKKEISAFDKQVNKLGKTFAGVFGAQQLFQFSKRAVQAFAADEKAAKSLEVQLRNTGFAFSSPAEELTYTLYANCRFVFCFFNTFISTFTLKRPPFFHTILLLKTYVYKTAASFLITHFKNVAV